MDEKNEKNVYDEAKAGGNALLKNEFEIHSLLQSSPVTYEPDNCPLCKAGIELVKPGGRPKPSEPSAIVK